MLPAMPIQDENLAALLEAVEAAQAENSDELVVPGIGYPEMVPLFEQAFHQGLVNAQYKNPGGGRDILSFRTPFLTALGEQALRDLRTHREGRATPESPTRALAAIREFAPP